MSNIEGNSPGHANAYKLFLIFFIPVLILWCLNWVTPLIFTHFNANNISGSIVDAYSKDNLARSGTFGDTFGAVNSLFSGLAFAGVGVAVIFQLRELRHQEEQTALARKAFSIADQQRQAADDERKRAEKYASLTASLNAATSLTQAYSQSIQLTTSLAETSVRALNPMGTGVALQRSVSRNAVAELMFSKYKQMQEMLLFEIQHFDDFYRERRDILSLKTKKEFFGRYIRTILSEWHRLTLEKVELDKSDRQGYPPDDQYSAKQWVFKRAHDQLRVIRNEVRTFLSQEGVADATFAQTLSGSILTLETVLDELRVIDGDDNEAVRLFFTKAYSAIGSFDVSGFHV